ncbi:MAG: hypothetical protein H6698_01375 [Myxococcales bacterium]|nr:hypothetical protein [Myxococcales bacterium]MCB9531050.1 hypothetical protein [Myxococcales bacterium]MCB9532960.1 hypothetical protein [Myxococcales bacterium]
MKAYLLAATLVLLAVPGAAHAQQDGEGRTRIYEFGDILIDGAVPKPSGTCGTLRGRAQFQSLVRIRRSFMGEVEAAAHADALD